MSDKISIGFNNSDGTQDNLLTIENINGKNQINLLLSDDFLSQLNDLAIKSPLQIKSLNLYDDRIFIRTKNNLFFDITNKNIKVQNSKYVKKIEKTGSVINKNNLELLYKLLLQNNSIVSTNKIPSTMSALYPSGKNKLTVQVKINRTKQDVDFFVLNKIPFVKLKDGSLVQIQKILRVDDIEKDNLPMLLFTRNTTKGNSIFLSQDDYKKLLNHLNGCVGVDGFKIETDANFSSLNSASLFYKLVKETKNPNNMLFPKRLKTSIAPGISPATTSDDSIDSSVSPIIGPATTSDDSIDSSASPIIGPATTSDDSIDSSASPIIGPPTTDGTDTTVTPAPEGSPESISKSKRKPVVSEEISEKKVDYYKHVLGAFSILLGIGAILLAILCALMPNIALGVLAVCSMASSAVSQYMSDMAGKMAESYNKGLKNGRIKRNKKSTFLRMLLEKIKTKFKKKDKAVNVIEPIASITDVDDKKFDFDTVVLKAKEKEKFNNTIRDIDSKIMKIDNLLNRYTTFINKKNKIKPKEFIPEEIISEEKIFNKLAHNDVLGTLIKDRKNLSRVKFVMTSKADLDNIYETTPISQDLINEADIHLNFATKLLSEDKKDMKFEK